MSAAGLAARLRADAGAVARVLRHPVSSLRAVPGDGPLYPLLILFGLNAVDELDRSALSLIHI